MQWLSTYGDSKSSLSEILLDGRERFMGPFLCCLLDVWVLLIKLPKRWRRSPRHRPIWPACPARTHGGDWALQHLAPKVLKQHFFFFILAFPSDTFFHIFTPLPTHFFFFSCHLLTALSPWRPALFPTFSSLCLLTLCHCNVSAHRK